MKLKHRRITALSLGLLSVIGLLGGCKDKGEAPDTLPQFTEVAKGEKIVEMTIQDYGTIKIRFFEKQAPKAVENFLTHCQDGYYDGVTFHRVVKDFMIQGGDPEGTGLGGESIWGKGFGVEASRALYHFRGALSMAHSSQPNSNGSQFFIVQNPSVTADYLSAVKQQTGVEYAEQVEQAYLQNGGVPYLDGDYTVFGQVFEGMEVIDKIADCEVTYNASMKEASSPVQKIVIESAKVVTYN